MTSKRFNTDRHSKHTCNSLKVINNSVRGKQNPQLDQLSTKRLILPSQKILVVSSITPQTLKEISLQLLQNSFSEEFPSFVKLTSSWIENNWKEMRARIQSRLSKLLYLQPTLQFQPFSTIQKQIRLQWSKNPLLRGVHMFWCHVFLTHQFQNIKQIQKYYNSFTHLIGTITYQLYYNSFLCLINKDLPVMHKLQYGTAVSIITENKQWRIIYKRVLEPYLCLNVVNFSQNFNIANLEINPIIANIHSKQILFVQTKRSIQKLIDSATIAAVVVNLLQFRSNLLKEIEKNIDIEVKKRGHLKHVTVQKEDILSVIIYVLVKYQLNSLGTCLQYINFLLGLELDEVLREHRVNSYLTDLQAAYEYLTTPVIKINFYGQNNNEKDQFGF